MGRAAARRRRCSMTLFEASAGSCRRRLAWTCHFRTGVALVSLRWHDPPEVAATRAIPVTVGPKGRLVVPAPLRRELGIEPGDVLGASVEDDRLVLESRATILERIRRRFDHITADVSLVDELIAERRREAERERAEYGD